MLKHRDFSGTDGRTFVIATKGISDRREGTLVEENSAQVTRTLARDSA
jgi:hypothetical protein